MVTIWSPWLRLMHWLLAISTILAFVSHAGTNRLHPWHEVFGYAALATAASRILLGFVGRGYWRFDQFVKSRAATQAYALAMLAHREPRHLGHNPLGAWMVVALLANSVLCGLSGWLFTTDLLWGYAWLSNLHGVLGELFVPMVLLHLAGVAYASWRHKESLISAMMHGKKQP